MKCEHVQALLVAYLDREITPSDRVLIQAHLSSCIACQKEMALQSAMQNRISSALQRRAALAVPSPQAWNRLEARLAEEARPSPSRQNTRRARLAPSTRRMLIHIFTGGLTMRRILMLATTVAVLALALAGISMLGSATPVSAQDILNRSYAAQEAADSSQGIVHLRAQVYQNFQALPGKRISVKEVKSILESYVDLQTGKHRFIVTDEVTGQVMSVSAFDGTYRYAGDELPPPGETGAVHIIYRSPQPKEIGKMTVLKPLLGPVDAKSFFEAARQDPTAQFIGQETWSDGRAVNVLRLQQLGKVLLAPSQPDKALPPTTATLYFDAKTFELVGQQLTVQQNGKETLISSTHQLVREILPATIAVAWDLSDLKGITVVDDPRGEHGLQLPVAISPQELAALTHSAYMLRAAPAGFMMQISVPPGANQKAQGMYFIEYRNSDGDDFLINGGANLPESLIQSADGTYTTRSGLTLYFVRDPLLPGAKPLSHAIVKATDGTLFDLTSTLPRERIKALAEELVPIK
jgi:hypothetical protein